MGVRDLQQGDSPRRFVPLRKLGILSKQLRPRSMTAVEVY